MKRVAPRTPLLNFLLFRVVISKMDIFQFGKVPWWESQLIYHALARLGREGLCLVSPAEPYVCLGYHQDVKHEVDMDFCRSRGIPVFRREVGGGAVYLDGDQYFFQVILNRDSQLAPARIENFYRKFLKPVINVYRRVGLAAEYKPINDLVAGSRKISGSGAGEIGDSIVFVGNLIMDFDYETMARVLKIPDEKFRDRVKKNIEDNLGTIRREIGEAEAAKWNEDLLNDMMAGEFAKILGPMTPREKDPELMAKVEELRELMINDHWLGKKGKRHNGRVVRIRSGLEAVHRLRKAPGGLLRIDYGLDEGRLAEVSISGDFFCRPLTKITELEEAVTGKTMEELEGVIREFYEKGGIETPGVKPDDWFKAITGAVDK